jgi:hypothetical protein
VPPVLHQDAKPDSDARGQTLPLPCTQPLALSLALFLFLFSVYLLTYSPRFHSSDGLAMFATAESLARRGEWDIDQIRWMGLQQGTFGLDGHLYSRKGTGVSVLALPLAWLGLTIPGWGTATTALVFNALVTAATGAVLVRYLQALGYDDRAALIAGLTFGLATLAWPYAKTFFSDPLAALCLTVAALALLHFRDTGRSINTFGAGLALAVAVATRYANVVVIPFFGLLLLKYQMSNQRISEAAKQRTPAPPQVRVSKLPNHKSPISHTQRARCLPWPTRQPALPAPVGAARAARASHGPVSDPGRGGAGGRQSPISNLRAWAAFGVPLIAIASAIAYYNVARYGNPFNTGYLPQENFSGILWQGIAGLLISPGRGLFLYAPVLLVMLPAIPSFFRRHRAEAALAGTIILVHLLLYGKWFMWHGGYAWGPRFMVPTLPFFVIGMAPVIEWARESIWWRRGFLVLASLSGVTQILGLSVHFELFQNRLLDTGLPLFAPITFFDPRYSPLLGQFQFLRPENLDFAWITDGQMDWPLLIALVAAVLINGWRLLKAGRLEDWKTGRMQDWKDARLEGRKAGHRAIFQSSNLPAFQSSSLPVFVTLVAMAWLLAHAHTLPPSDLRNAVALLNAHTTTADAVVNGTPEESVAFADLYKEHADVLGLNAGGLPLEIDTSTALARTAQNHPRVWWLPNWLPPEQSGVEMWLMRNGFRAEDGFIGERRLSLYYFPPEPLTESAVDVTFGDVIALERVDTLPTARSGSVLPVALHWRATHPVPADYHVFVHLITADGNTVAQSDGQPALWTRPTSTWSPGERIEDRHALSLPVDLPAGDYTLITGLYLPDNGERLLSSKEETFAILNTVQITGEER